MDGVVAAVSRGAGHTLAKPNEHKTRLLAAVGVEDDAHSGATVRHRSRLARFASEPNLRQVHLIHAELHDELKQRGFAISAGQMGENIPTCDVDQLALPSGAQLHLGAAAVIEVSGLSNPCAQLDRIPSGLMGATAGRDASGDLVRKAGIMAVVLRGGEVRPNDPIRVELPPQPHCPLARSERKFSGRPRLATAGRRPCVSAAPSGS
jgi:MOSC domain-containing protein YiiM